MGRAEEITLSENDKSLRQILGVNFFTGNASEAVDRMNRRGGLLVVPAAPALKDLDSNQGYREALVNADFAITDSAFMVLIWNCIDRHRIPRVSGLTYLREFLSRSEMRVPGTTFWIMASTQSALRNADWLRSRGFPLMPDDIYIAPLYGVEIADPLLLAALRHRRPRHIVVTIGGGTQERLGLYLKRSLDFSPSIHCIGAAISFLSGDQIRIPQWADHLCLGWLFRCLWDPRRYVARYWAARKLLPLMLRYRRNLPALEAN
jgi:N-acetylglucosaminyldiphosphoundecaprenol N-acetyl-beta-D-mannosaminyltransferase